MVVKGNSNKCTKKEGQSILHKSPQLLPAAVSYGARNKVSSPRTDLRGKRCGIPDSPGYFRWQRPGHPGDERRGRSHTYPVWSGSIHVTRGTREHRKDKDITLCKKTIWGYYSEKILLEATVLVWQLFCGNSWWEHPGNCAEIHSKPINISQAFTHAHAVQQLLWTWYSA